MFLIDIDIWYWYH